MLGRGGHRDASRPQVQPPSRAGGPGLGGWRRRWSSPCGAGGWGASATAWGAAPWRPSRPCGLPWAARSPPRAWSAATCRCARLGPRGGVGAPRSARAKTGGAPRGRSSSRLTTFVGPMPASARRSPGPCRPTARARPRSGALPAGDGSRMDRSGLEPARGLAVSGAPGAPASGGGSTPRGGKRHGEGACADGRRPHGRCRGRHQGSEGHWEAVLPLSSRPLGPCDGRQAGLVYLPARWRDTTRSRATILCTQEYPMMPYGQEIWTHPFTNSYVPTSHCSLACLPPCYRPYSLSR